jgi:serralysin
MTTYYVSTNGRDSASGTSGSPWKTISKAMKANLKPGDEVVVRSGVYKESVTINKDGNAGNYITIRSEVPGGAKIDVPDGNTFGINVNANYINVDGFEVYGSTRSGIMGNKVHHVKITDNVAHDNKSGGIYFAGSDFLTVEGNVVYKNASSAVISGISIHLAQNITGSNDNSTFRIVVKNNVAYDNITKNAAHTDGNGIIIDDFQASKSSKYGAYKFKTLVEGNITYNNGSSGISVFTSDYVTVRENIAWHNNQDLKSSGNWRGEIQNTNSSHNTWIGNIAVADLGTHKDNTAIANVSWGSRNTDITWRDNITFNGKSGDASIRTSSGNAAPTAKDNDLGKNAGLSLSEIKSMAAKLAAGNASVSVETSTASADSDTGSGTSKTTDKVLTGASGNDKLTGGTGDDKLTGKAGADKLYGGSGDDTLDGGKGKDQLQGGTGKDVLVGGSGADDFVFKSIAEAGKGGGRDVIRDFSHAQGDDIHLSAIDANTKAAGNQAFSFIGEKAFSGKAGQLQYKNGIVAGDVNGDKVAEFHIDIANHASLHANDFIL